MLTKMCAVASASYVTTKTRTDLVAETSIHEKGVVERNPKYSRAKNLFEEEFEIEILKQIVPLVKTMLHYLNLFIFAVFFSYSEYRK